MLRFAFSIFEVTPPFRGLLSSLAGPIWNRSMSDGAAPGNPAQSGSAESPSRPAVQDKSSGRHDSALGPVKTSANLTSGEDRGIEEGKGKYRPGGLHPVYIGHIFDEHYEVLRKIGWGQYSAVWLVKDTRKQCALLSDRTGSEGEYGALKVLSAESAPRTPVNLPPCR